MMVQVNGKMVHIYRDWKTQCFNAMKFLKLNYTFDAIHSKPK